MAVFVSLLRGVNVGGRNKVKMEVLREAYEDLGMGGVRTYLQSGNAVFRTTRRDPATLIRDIEDVIELRFGFHADVVLRTAAELRATVAANPFAARAGMDPARLGVAFLRTDPGAEAWAKVDALRIEPEEMVHSAREMYVYFPNGMGRSKFPFAAIDRAVKTPTTVRNWNTVTALLALAEGFEGH